MAVMVHWCGRGGMCGCDGMVVVVGRVCVSAMVTGGCGGEGESRRNYHWGR